MAIHLVSGVRSPFCKAGTDLDGLPAHVLGGLVLREALERADVDPAVVDAVVVGNVANPPEAANVGRVIQLLAGLRAAAPAVTLSRNCASGMEAVVDAGRRIECGEASLVAVVGVESMSRVPILYPDGFRRLLGRVARARGPLRRLLAWSRLRPRHLRPIVALRLGLTDPVSGLNMGETAEILADEFGIDRDQQDAYALRSHQRAVAAAGEGRFEDEVTPLFLPPRYERVVAQDVGPRPQQSLAALARLRPAFRRGGTVTAGNSSMVTDGAVALLVAGDQAVRELGLKPLARLLGQAAVGCEPRRMGLGPAYATPLALERAGVRLRDIDRIELNEAFAAQVLACQAAFTSRRFAERELGRSEAIGDLDDDRLNVDGGAIALGHPVGATGARLLLHLAGSLRRSGGGVGLATLCVGGGQGQAVVLEAA